ncbi:MAG: DUF3426 domain-containing protein [Alphaproteobacteria bacterium]|nr:DUF3426 domain-containing protein [Alphaproteobacteria bacterium]
MKIKCDVCKTEYNLPTTTSGEVRCAVCGHMWVIKNKTHRSGLMVFFASLCALLAATVFAVAVIVTSRHDNPGERPLVAVINDIQTVTNDDNTQLVVTGTVTNRSDDIYAFPDLVIVLYGEDGSPIVRQRFMPSATFLDVGQSVGFTHRLSGSFPGVKRVAVELMNMEDKK